jgi:hypothetical protein
MNTQKRRQSPLIVALLALCSGAMALGASPVLAWDGQLTAAWQCKPAGNENQVSAQYFVYRSDGAVANNSTTSDISVVCPVHRKQDNAEVESVSIHYEDNHAERAVRCSLNVVNQTSGARAFIASGSSRDGAGQGDIILRNSDGVSGVTFVACTIPAKQNGKQSSLQSVFVKQDTGYEPSTWCKISPFCFDPSGISDNLIPGAAAQRVAPEQDGLAAYFISNGAVANIAYNETLSVVFPLVRDDTTSTAAPNVRISATLRNNNLSLARCSLYQTNDGLERGEASDLSWTDPDGDGSGWFVGTGHDASMTRQTVFSVKCDIPPRTAAGISQINHVAYYE